MNELRSYPKIVSTDHRLAKELWTGPVYAQEKVDGSQFSFGNYPGQVPHFQARSKRQVLHEGAVPNLFRGAYETAKKLFYEGALIDNWTYRGEALQKPKHNTLEYGRVPRGNIILFDIDMGQEDFFHPQGLLAEAERIGLECVPTVAYFEDKPGIGRVLELLEYESVLGGTKIEGVVFKPMPHRTGPFSPEGKTVMAKYVSAAFKEKHSRSWKPETRSKGSLVDQLGDMLRTDARWLKAVQARRDAGELNGDPTDIGPLLKAIQQDIEAEEKEWAMEQAWRAIRKPLLRSAVRGFPEWYKENHVEGGLS